MTPQERVDSEIEQLKAENKETRETLCSLIAWMAKSDDGPISEHEGRLLLARLRVPTR